MAGTYQAPDSELKSQYLEDIIFEAASQLKAYMADPSLITDRRGQVSVRVDFDRQTATIQFTAPVGINLDEYGRTVVNVLPFVNRPAG